MATSPLAAFTRQAKTAPDLPFLEALTPLYEKNVYLKQGHLIMIVGRSGSMKSTTALFLAEMWGLSTLYFSADMSAAQATLKLAALRTQTSTREIEDELAAGGDMGAYEDVLDESKIQFSFRSPITFDDITAELNAWATLYNEFPKVIVIDNLQDMAGAESEYSEQMFIMSALSDLSRTTGSTILVLHHATESGQQFRATDYAYPPSRNSIKNKVTEKPELILGVAARAETHDLFIAPLKNRLGFADPSGKDYVSLKVDPEKNLISSPEPGDYLHDSSRIWNGA